MGVLCYLISSSYLFSSIGSKFIVDFRFYLYLNGFSVFLLNDKFKAKLPLKLSSLFSSYVSSSKLTEKSKSYL